MDFQKEVIQESEKQPVLVDFWAEWCGPCKVLGPILEGLDQEQSRWKLVQVDVDKNPEISQKFGIKGIPDVRLFKNGEVIAQFSGAKSKHEIIKWLEINIPDERMVVLETLISDLPQSEKNLSNFVENNPDLKIGQIALARHIIWSNPKKATELIGSVSPGLPFFEEAEAIKLISRLPSIEFTETPVEIKLCECQKAIAEGDLELAISVAIEAVMIDKTYLDDFPRRLTIAFFTLLGQEHELTRKYRKRFDMALY